MTKRKNHLVAVIICVLAFIMVMGMITATQNEDGENPTSSSSESSAPPVYDPVAMIMATCSITENQAKTVVDTLHECGLTDEIESVIFFDARQESDGNIYEMKVGKYSLMLVLTGTGDILEINLKKSMLQFYAEGEIKYKILDHETESTYEVATYMLIEKILKHPKDSDLNSASWSTFWQEGYIYVQGSVDAMNSFGVTSELKFQFKYLNGDPVSIIIDGKEYLQ